MTQPRSVDELWGDGDFRLFLTHVAEQKIGAHGLKYWLSGFGVDAFVAHDDIQPGEEWQATIKSALHSCDALAGLLHRGFRESDWCDQEVGIALGRGIPAVPIQCDLPPYGFIGSVQAVRDAPNAPPQAVARELVLVLLRDDRTSVRLTQAIVNRLAGAESFDQANSLSRILSESAPKVSREQTEQLRYAEMENYELQNAFFFDDHLSAIEAKIEATEGIESQYDFDLDDF